MNVNTENVTSSLITALKSTCSSKSLLVCTHVATTCFLPAMGTLRPGRVQLERCNAYSRSCKKMRDNSGVLPQAQLVELSHLINMVRISHNSKSRHDTIHLNQKCLSNIGPYH